MRVFRMPRRINNEGLRKENITICIPRYLKDALESSGNKSELITQILEENSDRILCGDVDTARQYKEQFIRQKVLDEFNIISTKIKFDTGPVPQLTKLADELHTIHTKIRQLNKEVNQIKSNSSTVKKELKSRFENIIKESYSELIDNET